MFFRTYHWTNIDHSNARPIGTAARSMSRKCQDQHFDLRSHRCRPTFDPPLSRLMCLSEAHPDKQSLVRGSARLLLCWSFLSRVTMWTLWHHLNFWFLGIEHVTNTFSGHLYFENRPRRAGFWCSWLAELLLDFSITILFCLDDIGQAVFWIAYSMLGPHGVQIVRWAFDISYNSVI